MLSRRTFIHSLYSVLAYIPEVINKTFSQYSLNFLSLVLCVHLDRVYVLCDPNNYFNNNFVISNKRANKLFIIFSLLFFLFILIGYICCCAILTIT